MSSTGMESSTSEMIVEEKPDVVVSGNFVSANHAVICLCCGNEFSSQMTKICPQCGYPAFSMSRKPERILASAERFSQEKGISMFTGAYKTGLLYELGSYRGERIQWRILEITDGKAFLLSEKALDCLPYHQKQEDLSWEESDIRKWLNTTFYQTAFSHGEKESILLTGSMDHGGIITEDFVFLLSVEELREYLKSSLIKKCYPSDYMISEREETEQMPGCCRWWLRSMSRYPGKAETVTEKGMLGVTERDKQSVTEKGIAVRPAIWIQL